MPSFSEILASHQNDTSVILAGDWHGNTAWALAKLNEIPKDSLILHLGDFGLWNTPKGERFLSVLNRKCARLNIHIFITPGNHENWDWLFETWDRQINPQPIPVASHLWALPRGYIFSLSHKRFMSFGGAASVDFDNRTLGKNWWPRELFTIDDVEKAKQAKNIDVLLAHETPEMPYAVPLTEEILLKNPMGFREEGLAYSTISRQRFTEVLLAVKPKLLAHGHIHVFEEKIVELPKASHATRILSLDKDKKPNNIYELLLETL